MISGMYSARPDDLAMICQRVQEKFKSYKKYGFSSRYNDFLKAFFDLVQEFDSLEDFYRICVAVPLEITNMECRLYLNLRDEQQAVRDERQHLWLVCDSRHGVAVEPKIISNGVSLQKTPYETEDSFVVPICNRQMIYSRLQNGSMEYSMEHIEQQTRGEGCPQQAGATESWHGCGKVCGRFGVLGMLSVSPLAQLNDADKFFLGKYANRIGFNLENRLIARQNIDHLKFINTLVMDIEHNVIVPNMYFIHLFNQLKRKVVEIESIEKEVEKNIASGMTGSSCADYLSRCRQIRMELFRCHQELVKHHKNISLFLESLFRREHFEKGHLVLRPHCCFVEKEIIIPQLDHYRSRLRAANIEVRPPRNMLEEEFQIMVDIGLLSQVYANLFSNAVKYTEEVVEHDGGMRKFMAYGRKIINNFSGTCRTGIKFNVFSSGYPLSVEDGRRFFEEGIRGDGSENVPGTGHGLSFVRYVIELHGGQVGYEPTPYGNNFYFILPLPQPGICPVAMPELDKG